MDDIDDSDDESEQGSIPVPGEPQSVGTRTTCQPINPYQDLRSDVTEVFQSF
jgi:hypothetical protein